MSFEWSEYLDFSKELIFPSGKILYPANEVILRICISRAYYSVFCLSRNYLRDIENNIIIKKAYYNNDTRDLKKNGGIHKYVFTQFRSDREKIYVANKLKKLKVRREKADYHDEYDGNIQKEIIRTINDAEFAIIELNKLYQKYK